MSETDLPKEIKLAARAEAERRRDEDIDGEFCPPCFKAGVGWIWDAYLEAAIKERDEARSEIQMAIGKAEVWTDLLKEKAKSAKLVEVLRSVEACSMGLIQSKVREAIAEYYRQGDKHE